MYLCYITSSPSSLSNTNELAQHNNEESLLVLRTSSTILKRILVCNRAYSLKNAGQ
jgi:hypothetical protein